MLGFGAQIITPRPVCIKNLGLIVEGLEGKFDSNYKYEPGPWALALEGVLIANSDYEWEIWPFSREKGRTNRTLTMESVQMCVPRLEWWTGISRKCAHK